MHTISSIVRLALRPWDLQEAAAQLGIGLSVLKRVCRTIGLARWPYRKRQSLRNVVEQTKLYLNVSGLCCRPGCRLMCTLPVSMWNSMAQVYMHPLHLQTCLQNLQSTLPIPHT